MYQVLKNGSLEEYYQIDLKDSWMYAAMEKESADGRAGLGRLDDGQYVRRPRHHRRCRERPHRPHRHRVHDDARRLVHERIAKTIRRSASSRSAAASRAISRSASCRCCIRTCSATDVPVWGYFCQISDSTTSYGSYSGAVPNEKITWGKLEASTPKYIVESDASIVAPLMFAYILGW